jgi:Holliday junction DNA helicase RuvA
MIAYLKGNVLKKGADSAVIVTGGIGYLVHLTPRTLDELKSGGEASLHTHLVVKEDAHVLYGFVSEEELRLFLRLIDVQGVGARMALHVMALGPVGTVRAAIGKGDVAFLSSAKGVGTKTAQRIVLELKGKLVEEDGETGTSGELVSALENLGYSRGKARQAAASVPPEGTTEERIKMALRLLSK